MRRMLRRATRALATGLGSGYSPFAPGTAGSAVGLAAFWPLATLAPLPQAAATGVLLLLGVAASSAVAHEVGLEDPGIVVIDEVVGMWVTLLALPFTLGTALIGFVAFRVMDIVKPWPARDLERLRGGWGIMADDVAAGIYAHLVLRAALIVWPTP
jgi:phosphatidylglycerophosphatase A